MRHRAGQLRHLFGNTLHEGVDRQSGRGGFAPCHLDARSGEQAQRVAVLRTGADQPVGAGAHISAFGRLSRLCAGRHGGQKNECK